MKLIVKMQSDDGKLSTNNPHELACYEVLANTYQPFHDPSSDALVKLWERAQETYGRTNAGLIPDIKAFLDILSCDETATIITAVAERREEYRRALALVQRQVDACNAPAPAAVPVRRALALVQRQVDACNAPAPAAVPVSASNVDPVEVFQFSERDPLAQSSQNAPSVAGTKKEQPKGGLDYRK